MTRVPDDNLGRRLFQIQKEKAVEEAMEKILFKNQKTGAALQGFSPADHKILREILGDLWTSIDRDRWKGYSFSKLSDTDIRTLIATGRQGKTRKVLTDDDIRALDLVLSKTV